MEWQSTGKILPDFVAISIALFFCRSVVIVRQYQSLLSNLINRMQTKVDPNLMSVFSGEKRNVISD